MRFVVLFAFCLTQMGHWSLAEEILNASNENLKNSTAEGKDAGSTLKPNETQLVLSTISANSIRAEATKNNEVRYKLKTKGNDTEAKTSPHGSHSKQIHQDKIKTLATTKLEGSEKPKHNKMKKYLNNRIGFAQKSHENGNNETISRKSTTSIQSHSGNDRQTEKEPESLDKVNEEGITEKSSLDFKTKTNEGQEDPNETQHWTESTKTAGQQSLNSPDEEKPKVLKLEDTNKRFNRNNADYMEQLRVKNLEEMDDSTPMHSQQNRSNENESKNLSQDYDEVPITTETPHESTIDPDDLIQWENDHKGTKMGGQEGDKRNPRNDQGITDEPFSSEQAEDDAHEITGGTVQMKRKARLKLRNRMSYHVDLTKSLSDEDAENIFRRVEEGLGGSKARRRRRRKTIEKTYPNEKITRRNFLYPRKSDLAFDYHWPGDDYSNKKVYSVPNGGTYTVMKETTKETKSSPKKYYSTAAGMSIATYGEVHRNTIFPRIMKRVDKKISPEKGTQPPRRLMPEEGIYQEKKYEPEKSLESHEDDEPAWAKKIERENRLNLEQDKEIEPDQAGLFVEIYSKDKPTIGTRNGAHIIFIPRGVPFKMYSTK